MKTATILLIVTLGGCVNPPGPKNPEKQIIPTGDVLKDCVDWKTTAIIWKKKELVYADCNYDGDWDVRTEDGFAANVVVNSQKEVIRLTTNRLLDLASDDERQNLQGEMMNGKIQRGGSLNGTQNVCVKIQNDPSGRELCGDDEYILRGSPAWKKFQQQFENAFNIPKTAKTLK